MNAMQYIILILSFIFGFVLNSFSNNPKHVLRYLYSFIISFSFPFSLLYFSFKIFIILVSKQNNIISSKSISSLQVSFILFSNSLLNSISPSSNLSLSAKSSFNISFIIGAKSLYKILCFNIKSIKSLLFSNFLFSLINNSINKLIPFLYGILSLIKVNTLSKFSNICKSLESFTLYKLLYAFINLKNIPLDL